MLSRLQCIFSIFDAPKPVWSSIYGVTACIPVGVLFSSNFTLVSQSGLSILFLRTLWRMLDVQVTRECQANVQVQLQLRRFYLFIYFGLTVCLLGVRGSVCQMAQQVCRLAGGHVAPRRRWRGSQSERGGNGVGALPLSLAQLELCYIIKYGESWAKMQMFALGVRITEQQALRFFFLGGH